MAADPTLCRGPSGGWGASRGGAREVRASTALVPSDDEVETVGHVRAVSRQPCIKAVAGHMDLSSGWGGRRGVLKPSLIAAGVVGHVVGRGGERLGPQ